MKGMKWLALALFAIVAGAAGVHCAVAGSYAGLGDTSASNEEALGQMTLGFYALAGNQLAQAAAEGGGVPEMNAQVAEQTAALVDKWKAAAQEAFGPGLLRVGGDGKMTIDLSPFMGALAPGAAGAAGLDLDLSKVLAAPQVVALGEAVSANYQAAIDAFAQNVKEGADLLVNELQGPGARVFDRLQQLEQIVNSATNGGEACGAYEFNPGGASVPAQWRGPTFTLTQTTGNCALVGEVRGQGNVDWTQAVGRLACLGPSTQYGFTPLRYRGVSREPASLDCPECKYVYRFGPEVEVVLYGGETKDPVVFDSEKDFYTAAVLNKTFDFNLLELKAVLASLQKNIDAGAVRLTDLLRVRRGLGASGAGADALGGLLGALRTGLKDGQLLQGVEQVAAEQAAALRAAFEERRKGWEEGSSSSGSSSWMRPGGGFDTTAYFNTIKDKLASGAFLNRGTS